MKSLSLMVLPMRKPNAVLEQNPFQNLNYFLVPNEERGLTKQRNYGVARVAQESEVICFLDDDTILEPQYFEEIIRTYQVYPEALGVGGYISNESKWIKVADDYKPTIHEFAYDGWKQKDGSRFVMRQKIRLGYRCKTRISSRVFKRKEYLFFATIR